MSENKGLLITTDSVCDIPCEMLEGLPVAVCPYYVHTSGGQFLDEKEISAGEIMDYMEKSGNTVSSESPTVSDYREFFMEQKKNRSKILHISMGRFASKGYDNARAAAEYVRDVYVLDSGQISSGLGLVVLKAARLAKEGMSLEELTEEVSSYSRNVSSSFIIREMEFLNRSGRLSDRARRFCEKLMLHPKLVMKGSRIAVGGVSLGLWSSVKKAYVRKELRDFDRLDNELLFITHAGLSQEDLVEIREETEKYADFKDIRFVEASPAISSNCGRGTFGLLFAKEGKAKRKAGGILKAGFNYVVLSIFALTMTLVLGLNVRLFYNMIEEQADAVGRQQLAEVSKELESTLYEAEVLTHKAASDVMRLLPDGMTEDAKDKLNAYLAEQKNNSGSDDCMSVYAVGTEWYSIPDFTEPDGFVATQRGWYRGARKKGVGNVYISAPYQDARTGEMCFTVAELLPDGDTVVAVDFSLESLQESVAAINMEGGDSLIVSQSGQIVVYSDTSVVGETLTDALPEYTTIFRKIIASGQDSMDFKTKIAGNDSTVFYNCTQNEWYLLSVVRDFMLYRENLSSMILYTLLNICFVIGIVILYVIGQRYRRRTERKLLRTQQSLSDISKEIKVPMEDMVRRSDYRMFLSSDDPDEYMGTLRKSSVTLKSTLSRLEGLGSDDKADVKRTRRRQKREGVRTEVSDSTNKKASAGIMILLSVTMVLCIVLSTTIMARWGNTRMEREADAYAAELNSWIVQQKSVLDMFVSYISANPKILSDYEECVRWLNDITMEYEEISVSYMTNPEAEHIVIMNNGWEPEADWKMEERQWYIGSMESEKEDGFYITTPYFDSQMGAYCVTISKRVYDKQGNYLGIFGIDFFLDKLTQILDSSYTNEGYAFLVDSDGRIINHPNAAWQMTDSNAVLLEEAGYLDAAYSEDTVLIKDYDGCWKAVYSTMNATSGFSIFCVKDWNVIYGSLVYYDIIFVVIFGVGIAITVILLRMMSMWQQRAIGILQESVEDARRAGESKSKFLAQMSHEIRTPINAVLGMNEMILRESRDRDIHEYSNNIQSAGRTLLTLINSILDFSKIEDGKMEIVPVQYDTASMINDLVNMVRERAEKKELLLKLEIDQKLPKTLYGDDVRLRQVITNILTNAVKYTQEGSVTLRIRSASRTVKDMILHVEVEDTGMGIREEDKAALFESFQRLDIEKNRNIEGTGLGISIVQKLLLMMDSALQLDSVYGEGSNFYFDIRQGIVDDTPIGNYEERLSVSEKAQGIAYVYAPEARVLVVDDNDMNLKVARGLLKRSAMWVDTAVSGKEAIEKLATADYDILFLDHMMPDMDGIETLREMQKRGMLAGDMPVIMMTANAIAGAREEYLKEGFDDYISKPIEVKAMEKLLREYLPKEKVSLKEEERPSEENAAPQGKAGLKEEERPSDENTAPQEEDKQIKGSAVEAADGEADPAVKEPAEAEGEAPKKKRIDEAVGLSYCMNDQDFYHDMLSTYVEEGAKKKADLSQSLEKGDLRLYTVTVHAVKSTSKTIGAVEFAEMAYVLEMAGKEGRLEDVRAGHEDLMREYDEVLKEAQGFLA